MDVEIRVCRNRMHKKQTACNSHRREICYYTSKYNTTTTEVSTRKRVLYKLYIIYDMYLLHNIIIWRRSHFNDEIIGTSVILYTYLRCVYIIFEGQKIVVSSVPTATRINRRRKNLRTRIKATVVVWGDGRRRWHRLYGNKQENRFVYKTTRNRTIIKNGRHRDSVPRIIYTHTHRYGYVGSKLMGIKGSGVCHIFSSFRLCIFFFTYTLLLYSPQRAGFLVRV